MLLDFAKLELGPGLGQRVVSGSSSSSSSRMHFFLKSKKVKVKDKLKQIKTRKNRNICWYFSMIIFTSNL